MKQNSINILFDCNGTLLKSLEFGMDSFNVALAQVGARPHAPDEIKRFYGRSAVKIFHQLLGNAEQAMETYEAYLSYEESHVARMYLHRI